MAFNNVGDDMGTILKAIHSGEHDDLRIGSTEPASIRRARALAELSENKEEKEKKEGDVRDEKQRRI